MDAASQPRVSERTWHCKSTYIAWLKWTLWNYNNNKERTKNEKVGARGLSDTGKECQMNYNNNKERSSGGII